MTEKLFDQNPYGTEFESVVISVTEEGGLYKTELKETLFFPEEGGQSPDKGSLNGLEVKDVKIKDGIIFHYLTEEIKVGTLVTGKIDWNHRFSNMQLHSGEHIFTGLVHNKFGYNNVGFHLSDNTATMDYDGPLTDEEVASIETEANKVIIENRAIKAWYPDKEELASLDYRSKKEINGPVRLVEIQGVDLCACCAPHVRLTGEIGFFKVINRENYKGGVRITYLCGFRALDEFRNKMTELKKIQNILSCKAGSEAENVQKNKDNLQEITYKYELLIKSKLVEDINILSKPIWIGSKEDAKYLRFIVDTMHSKFHETAFAFAGNEEEGFRFLIESESEDLQPFLKLLRERYNAKGGGKKESIQGSVLMKKEEILNITK